MKGREGTTARYVRYNNKQNKRHTIRNSTRKERVRKGNKKRNKRTSLKNRMHGRKMEKKGRRVK